MGAFHEGGQRVPHRIVKHEGEVATLLCSSLTPAELCVMRGLPNKRCSFRGEEAVLQLFVFYGKRPGTEVLVKTISAPPPTLHSFLGK